MVVVAVAGRLTGGSGRLRGRGRRGSEYGRVAAQLLCFGLLAPSAAGGPASADPPTALELDQRITAAARRLETVVEQYNDAGVALRETLARERALDGTLAPLEADVDARQRTLGGLAASQQIGKPYRWGRGRGSRTPTSSPCTAAAGPRDRRSSIDGLGSPP